MYAVTLDGFGGPEVMRWARVPDLPAPGPGEIPSEVSGHVARVGTDVQEWPPGDAVCALLPGGYAERVNVPVSRVLPVPEGVPPRRRRSPQPSGPIR